jgi:hypothetical protein
MKDARTALPIYSWRGLVKSGKAQIGIAFVENLATRLSQERELRNRPEH